MFNKIKNLSLAIIICTSLMWNANISNAQNFDSAPLFDFLKNTADSTIILSHMAIIYDYPDYYIVSKTGDTVNMYTYRYKNLVQPSPNVTFPKAISMLITHRNIMMMIKEQPDINALFEVKVADRETMAKL